jgi:SAM-dependent methyltransferase
MRPLIIGRSDRAMPRSLCCAGVTPSATTGLLGELTARSCPICGSTDDSKIFAEEHLDPASLDEYAFASRKRPEHMRLRLVHCPGCDLVYASPSPSPDALAHAYEGAGFDSSEEARYAARSYAEQLQDLLLALPDRNGALDIGTGEGAFLAELLKLGFTEVGGVEPSSAPIAAADPDVSGLIEHGVFHPGIRRHGSMSLVTCFQTIEHVPNPAELVRDAATLLKPGGILVIVCHDRLAPINRAMGLRSPIVDIEHMQLFSRRSVNELLGRAGLRGLGQRSIRNRYPMRYWARLAPLPKPLHTALSATLERTRMADRPLTVPVGNLLAWGVRD